MMTTVTVIVIMCCHATNCADRRCSVHTLGPPSCIENKQSIIFIYQRSNPPRLILPVSYSSLLTRPSVMPLQNMSNSVKLIEFFFERTEDPTLFRCRNAKCGDRTYKQRSGSGYTNLRNHLRTCIGPNFEDVYKSSSGQRTLEQLGLTNRRDREVHDLIDWIVSRNQPFSEVGHEVTQRVLRSERICSKTIRKYILNLVPIVEKTSPKSYRRIWHSFSTDGRLLARTTLVFYSRTVPAMDTKSP